jgi:hypothetical protein
MAKKTKNMGRKELEVEVMFLRRRLRADQTTTILTTSIRWGCAAGIAYFGYRSLGVLAGQNTTLSVILKVLVNKHVVTLIALLCGAGGVSYGLGERGVRKRSVERLQRRIEKFERGIDPGRSSSGLTPRGDTPENERI